MCCAHVSILQPLQGAIRRTISAHMLSLGKLNGCKSSEVAGISGPRMRTWDSLSKQRGRIEDAEGAREHPTALGQRHEPHEHAVARALPGRLRRPRHAQVPAERLQTPQQMLAAAILDSAMMSLGLASLYISACQPCPDPRGRRQPAPQHIRESTHWTRLQ